jgi:hypothetical protein
MSATIDRNQPITVTMTVPAGHWELVMQELLKGPYGIVAPLISEIQRQCMQHATPQWQPRANGGSPAGSEDATEGTSP